MTSGKGPITAPVALTCGEPAGVGPELAVAAYGALRDVLNLFWIGDPRHLPDGAPVVEIAAPDEAAAAMAHGLPVLPHLFPAPVTPGTLNPDNAQSVIDVIRRGTDLVQSGAAAALCTSPIHKGNLQSGAGFGFPGHTEFLAHLGGVDNVVMMLASPELRVVPTTIHMALKDVPNALTPDLLRDTIRITHRALRDQFGLTDPRIAVAGLNPHAGEGGAMGREEIEVMTPVISALCDEGMRITGPHSADTMFHPAARATYDVAICAYHDQALIPIKMLDFDRGVNVTLGLPFVRTSPDHGTALDIAGQGRANPSSTIAALRLAAEMGGA